MDEVNRKKEFASPRMTGLRDKSQRRVLSEEKLSVSLVVGCCMRPETHRLVGSCRFYCLNARLSSSLFALHQVAPNL